MSHVGTTRSRCVRSRLGTLFFGRDAQAGACVPGQQVACACPGGVSGVQACTSDGSRFDACACAAPAPVVVQQAAPPPVYSQPPRRSYRDEDDEDEDRPRRRHGSRPGSGLFAGGLAMTIIGGLLIPVGIALVAVGGNAHCQDRTSYSGSSTSYSTGKDGSLALCAFGTGLLIIDAGLIAGGIAMMVAGKNKMANAEAHLPLWIPNKVNVSAEGVSIGWRF